ncbi:MAG TPA: hypothetical protein VFU01_00940 [Gemmatimonadaceae bacterium]|nr:hypothetical protein [Gemmatimonadaceae bacterium]
MSIRHQRASRRVVLLFLVSFAASAANASAQQCDSVTSQTSLAQLSGRRIAALHIVTADPAPLPGPAAALNRLHMRTRASTVRRELLFAPGDTVDTLRVAESLRRLRQLRFLVDAEIRGMTCGGPVELSVVTRDGWSTKPNVHVGATSAAFEMRERNLFGTGRQATLSVRSDRGRIGLGAALRDPAALGDRAVLSIDGSHYRDGSEWSVTAARRERSLLDRWGYEAYFAQSSRTPLTGTNTADRHVVETFRRTRGGALLGRRISASDVGAMMVQAGIGYERAGLVAAPTSQRLGSDRVQREPITFDVGLRRRSVVFDTLTWLRPGNGLVDVPLAGEFDGLVGIGRERVDDTPVVHLDLWTGRMWRPDATALLVTDLWASGYESPTRLFAGALRGSATYYRSAPRGIWTARFGAEWLRNPDPDLRAMVTIDPAAGALPTRARLAEAAVALSLERAVRLHRLSRSWVLDGAAFAAVSTRWDPASPAVTDDGTWHGETSEGERLSVGVLGVGLRMAPTRLGRASARLDVGYPLLHAGGVGARPFVRLSISPWLQQGRHRDGRSEP